MNEMPANEPQERRQVPPWVFGAIALAIAVPLFVIVTKEKPSASGHITKVFAVQQKGVERCLVGIEVAVKNETDQEIILREINTRVKIADQQYDDQPAAGTEHGRYFQAVPEFKQSDLPPLPFDTKLPPHGSANGLLIISVPVTKETFDKRNSTEVFIQLYGRQPIVLRQ